MYCVVPQRLRPTEVPIPTRYRTALAPPGNKVSNTFTKFRREISQLEEDTEHVLLSPIRFVSVAARSLGSPGTARQNRTNETYTCSISNHTPYIDRNNNAKHNGAILHHENQRFETVECGINQNGLCLRRPPAREANATYLRMHQGDTGIVRPFNIKGLLRSPHVGSR